MVMWVSGGFLVGLGGGVWCFLDAFVLRGVGIIQICSLFWG